MILSPEIQEHIKTYLWEVASNLGCASPSIRTEILRDVESHIYEALAERNSSPTTDDLQSVLNAMPTADSYASEGYTNRRSSSASEQSTGGTDLTWDKVPQALLNAGNRLFNWIQQFAWESIVGVLLMLIGFSTFAKGLLLLSFGNAYNSAASLVQAPRLFLEMGMSISFIGLVFILFGLGILIAARYIGLTGISRIRNSAGHLKGFVGVYISFLVPQVIGFSILFAVAFALGSGILIGLLTKSSGFFPLESHVGLLEVILPTIFVDCYMIKYRWSPSRLARQSTQRTTS